MELNYKSYGSGKPLIVLHGLFGMLDNWQTFAKSMANSYEVFLLDIRNHGRSPHTDEMNYNLMARDVYEFLEEQNIFSANILGHSMGGKIAIQFAVFYPGFVDKLIIADMFPKVYKGQKDHQNIFQAIDAVNKGHFKSRADAEEAVAKVIPEDKIAMLMFKNLAWSEDEHIIWKFNAVAIKNEYQNLLTNIKISEPIKAPTLFLKGGNSDYLTNDDIASLPCMFDNYKVESIPNAGHWLHVDQPDIFRKKVTDFLKS
jgi:esterase